MPLIDKDKFCHPYSKTEGRPNASIRTMISLLIFMGNKNPVRRTSEYLFPRRIDWLIATCTPLREAHIDHTTLFKFFQRLEKDDSCRELFIEITDAFIKACGTSKAKELARRKVALPAKDLCILHCAFENHNQVKRCETFKILSRVFTRQCEVKDTADSDQQPEIQQRLIDNNFKPEKQYEDAGFVNGKTILKSVSELTHADGVRKSRHKDSNRTGLQLIFAAIACNVKHFIRHGQQYGYLEPAVQGCC